MNRECLFAGERNDVSREALLEQRKKMLRSLLLVFTLIAGEDLPIDTRPKTILPTAELKRPEESSKNPMIRNIQERMNQENRPRL